MDRQSEYRDLLAELDQMPEALAATVSLARTRHRKERRKRLLATPLTCLASSVTLFVLLVNTSLTFATACGKIPLISDLAAAVAFSPSLSAAVRNEYVQVIDLEQTANGVTMRVEYVIVDQKQVNIFYTLHSSVYANLDATLFIRGKNGETIENYTLAAFSAEELSSKGIRQFVIDFIDDNVPNGLELECRISDAGSPTGTGSQTAGQAGSDWIADFTFILDFDPEYTLQGEIITLNRYFLIDGQSLNISTVEIYPTHIRLNLNADPYNTAWLKSISFYFLNERGERFGPIVKGITVTGAADSPMTATFRLESSFFSESESLTMYISDATWLRKDMERIEVNLAKMTCIVLPEGVTWVKSERVGDDWEIAFTAPENEDGGYYDLFYMNCWDETGREYVVSEVMFAGSPELGKFEERFSLRGYPYDTVWLSPAFSHETRLNDHLAIPIM